MTGAACWAGNAYPSGTHEFTSGFQRGSYVVLSFLSPYDEVVWMRPYFYANELGS